MHFCICLWISKSACIPISSSYASVKRGRFQVFVNIVCHIVGCELYWDLNVCIDAVAESSKIAHGTSKVSNTFCVEVRRIPDVSVFHSLA